MGAYHAAEATYVFGRPWAFANPARFTPEQAALARRMRDQWTAFGRPAFAANWPAVAANGGPLKLFDPQGDRMDETFFARHHCDLWDGTPFGAVTH
jgi:para-nitrobenzyl esterase